MDHWHQLAEQQIKEAQEKGELDAPGLRGKPLDLTENPFVPEDQRLAFKLLKDNELAPDWIADGKEIREKIEKIVSDVRRSRRVFEQTLRRLDGKLDIASIYERQAAYDAWDKVRDRFLSSAAKINKLIETYNLRVPISSLQRLYFKAERELERLESGSGRR